MQTWEQLYAMFPYYQFKREHQPLWEQRGETPHMAVGFARAYEQYMADPLRYDTPNPQSDDDLIGARARIFAEVYLGEWLSVDDGIYQRRFDELDLLIRQCNGNVSDEIWNAWMAMGIAMAGSSWDASNPLLGPDGLGGMGGGGGGSRNRQLPHPEWHPTDFAPGKLNEKFTKHKGDWGEGNITEEAYRKRAIQLLDSSPDGEIEGFTNKNGFVFRYNRTTNEFATAKPDGTIETLYRPKDGLNYWLEQVRKYGP